MPAPAPTLPRTARFAVAVVVLALLALSGDMSDVTARAATPFRPDDPGRVADSGGWTELQWNFAGPYGVDAPDAWGNLIAAGAPGGEDVIVAVLDTGVAYASDTPGRSGSPDLRGTRFVPGYDFVDDDDDPYDENGHGTHVASTIAEQTDNGYGLTGLAYGVRIMPVRVLDRAGAGDPAPIARGIRFAALRGAKVINLSLNFPQGVTEAQIPVLLDAIEFAYDRGVLIVAGAGNTGSPAASYPARGRHIVSVGATTEHGCLASYSNYGDGVDLVAPGGGDDADIPEDANCRAGRPGAPIYQVTSTSGAAGSFEITGYVGTSMAAPHVAATAALVVASGAIGADPTPAALEAQLTRTARDLGQGGQDDRYGWGLVDPAKATSSP